MWRASLIFVCFALGCSSDEVARETAIPVTAPNEPVAADAPVEPSPSADIDLATVEIALERTTCRGWCPSYRVVIHGDGRVVYTGRKFVREVGEREGRISEQVVRDLLGCFETMRFFELRDAYEDNVKDADTEYLELRVGDQRKRIAHLWSSTPARLNPARPDREVHIALDALAVAIDEAVAIEQWVGPEPERRAQWEAGRK